MVLMALTAALVLAAPPAKTQLRAEIKPESALLYVDGKLKGSGKKTIVVNLEPGRHALKVVHQKDAHEEVISIKKGEVQSWSWAFEDDRMDRPQRPVPSGDEEAPTPAD